MKYACIAAHRHEFAVALMCRVLQVSRSGYYAWTGRPLSARQRRDEELQQVVQTVHAESRQSYGSPRVHRELRDRGLRVGRKRVARLMRSRGLRGKHHRKFRPAFSSGSSVQTADLLQRCFQPDSISDIDRVWAADITFLPTRQGWLYLAVLLDLASRAVVGWSMSATMTAELTLSALEMAIQRRQPGPGLLHHSDRGVQYGASEYRAALERHGIRRSMSRPRNCWDNAVAESFFATLKRELVSGADWRTRAEAKGAVFTYIETWYNRRRLHSSLGYLAPASYERQLQLKKPAA
ncbi:MAG TPA: IS3 family transposase [Longimicrobiales bacterium]|nr:IS3 family transposase [Longimicrobiales bacterium]